MDEGELQVEETGESLLKALTRHQTALRGSVIPEDRYTELVEKLEKVQKEEEEKGKFITHEGDIDQRGQDKRDIELSRGFQRECGVRGSKLSGG